jgi:hypothetical protein
MFLFDISTAPLFRDDIVEVIDQILKEPKEYIFSSFYNLDAGLVLSGTTGVVPRANVFIFFMVAFLIVSLLVLLN